MYIALLIFFCNYLFYKSLFSFLIKCFTLHT